MGWISLAVGIVAVFLGGLWLMQGLGLIVIDPILCVGDCEPLEGPSASWAVLGFIVLTLGALAIAYGLKRLGKRRLR
jgi:drug/metabolite transporter (DMT)-like permease